MKVETTTMCAPADHHDALRAATAAIFLLMLIPLGGCGQSSRPPLSPSPAKTAAEQHSVAPAVARDGDAPAPSPAAAPTGGAVPAPRSTPAQPAATPTADVRVTLVDFGGAQAPGHTRATTSGVVVRADVRSAGRVRLRAEDATAVLADGTRVPAALGFAIDSQGPVNVVMLENTTVEGMSIDIKERHYEAFSSMAKMAAHLVGGAGWAYDAEPGNVLTLGAVFDCPSQQVRELEMLGVRLDARRPASRAPSAVEASREAAAAAPKLSILAVKGQATLKVRRGKRPPFSEGDEPAPSGKRWLELNVELTTTDPKFKLLMQNIVLSDGSGHAMHVSWFGDVQDGAALSSVEEVTRESIGIFVDNQGDALYVVYPTDDGVTLGFPVRDAAHQALVASPPKIRVALAFAVPRTKQAYKLTVGNALQVAVAAPN